MSQLSRRLDRFCLNAAREAVREAMPEVLQSYNSQMDTGPVTIVSVTVVNGSVKATVKTQNGRVIEDVDAGSESIGPGATAILVAGKKLQ